MLLATAASRLVRQAGECVWAEHVPFNSLCVSGISIISVYCTPHYCSNVPRVCFIGIHNTPLSIRYSSTSSL